MRNEQRRENNVIEFKERRVAHSIKYNREVEGDEDWREREDLIPGGQCSPDLKMIASVQMR